MNQHEHHCHHCNLKRLPHGMSRHVVSVSVVLKRQLLIPPTCFFSLSLCLSLRLSPLSCLLGSFSLSLSLAPSLSLSLFLFLPLHPEGLACSCSRRMHLPCSCALLSFDSSVLVVNHSKYHSVASTMSLSGFEWQSKSHCNLRHLLKAQSW